jgi:Zn-dependent peptidase ImmA (M78 family)
MPCKSFEVDVEPGVLIWARESMGIEIAEVAKRFGLSQNIIKKWEYGQKKPTIIQIKKLAKFYKRPLAVFFLPSPPEEPPLPNDFRTLPDESRKPFSPETRLIIRKARRLQSLAIELAEGTNKDIHTNVGRVNLSDNPEIVANNERIHVGIDIQTQFSWSREVDAFEEWKKAVEKLGILVFQFPLAVEEIRGFSLPKDILPAIVLNRRDHVRARIFSLFHEYGHLLLDTDGICNWEILNGSFKTDGSVEKFCNHFAGAFLVPKDALQNHKLVRLQRNTSEWSDKDLEKVAKDFNVSREVILRRLVTFRLVEWDFYRIKYEKWKKIAKKEHEPKHLFDIEIRYKQYLEKGPINEILVNVFSDNNLALTKDAKIVQRIDNEWKIKDGNKIYLIKDSGIHLKIFKEKVGGGKQNIPKKCILENSIPFTSLVFDSYRKEKITYNDVADFLGIRAKYIPKVERFIGAKA